MPAIDLPFSAGPWAYLFLGAVVTLAAFARGYSGFGFSALLVAAGALVFAPVQVVPLAITMEVIASVMQAAGAWRHVAWGKVALLVAGAMLCNPVGIWLLTYLDQNAIRLVISALVFSASLIILSGWRLARPMGRPGMFAVGMGSGLANGTTALGGLPVAMFLTLDMTTPAVARASLIAFFFITDAYAGAIMASQGILTMETAAAAIWTLPFLALGLWLGGRRFAATTPDAFRRFVLALLIALAVLGVLKAFGLV